MSMKKTIYEKWSEDEITIIPETSILQLTYTHRFFDISLMRHSSKTVTVITKDGIIVSKNYKAGSRKVQAVRTTVIVPKKQEFSITQSEKHIEQLFEKFFLPQYTY